LTRRIARRKQVCERDQMMPIRPITGFAGRLRPVFASAFGLLAVVAVLLLHVAPPVGAAQAAPCHEMLATGDAGHHGHDDGGTKPAKPPLAGTLCPVLAGLSTPTLPALAGPEQMQTVALYSSDESRLDPVILDGPGRPPPSLS
jgi:hypothetical protein